MKQMLAVFLTVLSLAAACPDHNGLWKRENGAAEFDYTFPEDWAQLDDDYSTCSVGSTQTPINLAMLEGSCKYHIPSFSYPRRMDGSLQNSGTSLTFTLSAPNVTNAPSFSFQESNNTDEEVYLIGWHLHSPSEHMIDGKPAKAEMHFVHADAEGNARSVLGFLIQPSPGNRTQSSFFNQIPHPYPAIDSEEQRTMRLDPTLALKDVGGFERFWSYQGSLTTPPCTEGLRWFVAQQPLYVDIDTLQSILAVSKYSARPAQQRWMHGVNE